MTDREILISKIMDYAEGDEEGAKHAITRILGPKMVSDEQESMYSNGGGTLTVKDLCRLASDAQLKKIVKKYGIQRDD